MLVGARVVRLHKPHSGLLRETIFSRTSEAKVIVSPA